MLDIKDSESQLVGMALREPSVMVDFGDIQASHFFNERLGSIWNVLSQLRDAGEYSGDIATAVREMQLHGIYDRVGGAGAIAKLVHAAGLSSSASTHAADIRSEAERRRLHGVLVRFVAALGTVGADVTALRGRIDAELGSFAGATSSVESIDELVASLIQSASDPSQASQGIPTGLPTFDQCTGGLRGGELIIVAARPSVGKSALGAGIGLHASTQQHGVLFVSLEMTGRDVAARLLAAESGESFSSIRSGYASVSKLSVASEAFTGLPFRVWSGRSLTTERLRAVCRLEQSRAGLSLLVVDYIGLLTPSDKRKPRWEAVTEMSSDLKSLALSLNIPVIALCQLNRDAEGKQPELSHLRESGAIEQDADVVALLHRDRDSDSATLNIAKIRNGRPGAIDLHFDQRGTRFSEATVSNHSSYHDEFSEYA